MSNLPRTGDGRKSRDRTGSGTDPNGREVKPPELFVRVESRPYYHSKYAKARIRVRKGCYYYLVWRDGTATRELYLGKKETVTPRPRSRPPAPATSDQARARARARGTK